MAAQMPTATDLKSAFKVGDKVTWKSQAGGRWTTKTGEIIAVIPPKSMIGESIHTDDINSNKYAQLSKFAGHSCRNHESFLVSVAAKKNGKPSLYWPITSKLELAQTKAEAKAKA